MISVELLKGTATQYVRMDPESTGFGSEPARRKRTLDVETG
jgi:hypothetical protein